LAKTINVAASLDPATGIEHLVVTSDAIIKATGFRALLRDSGIPSASPDSLDADGILAGQASLAGLPWDTVSIATTNRSHLNRFPGVDAWAWDQIR